MSDEPPQRMTDAEIHKLAVDSITNQVFMSDQCRQASDIPMVFLAFALSGPELAEEYKKEHIIHLYEYHSKALPRSINGYPCFTSHRAINLTDYKRFRAEEDRMRKALQPCVPNPTSEASATPTHPSPTPSSRSSSRKSSWGSGSRSRSK